MRGLIVGVRPNSPIHTTVVEFSSRRRAKAAFGAFTNVRIRRENFDNVKLLPREWFLGAPARLLGVDLYITAIAEHDDDRDPGVQAPAHAGSEG